MPVLTLNPTRSSSILRGDRSWPRRLVFARLSLIQEGPLEIEDRWGARQFGSELASPFRARITVQDPSFYRRVLWRGALGAAESYMDGDWECEDLTSLFRLFVRNPQLNVGIDRGVARLLAPLQKIGHRLRRNTRPGSRRNIHAHYDLGNEFFALFLDPTLSYSCAIFEAPEASLEEAAVHKLDQVCRKLELRPEDHLLEIGTGWGGLALHAAQRFGCQVTTTTISRRQYEYARRRVEAAGLSSRIEVLNQDYRDVRGQYDKVVSIEMIEAVGPEYFETFFRCCSERLAPDGLMLLQAITVADRHFERTSREVDFIKKYIFPGSCIPSVGALTRASSRATDMDLVGLEDIGIHYARTLREWRKRFLNNRARIRSLGFDERFMRMWEYYFCYCEAGFDEEHIRDVHMRFAKPRRRSQPPTGVAEESSQGLRHAVR